MILGLRCSTWGARGGVSLILYNRRKRVYYLLEFYGMSVSQMTTDMSEFVENHSPDLITGFVTGVTSGV